MDYNHIKNYLEKFKNILFTKDEIYQVVLSVIENNISFKIERKFIQLKTPILYVKSSPMVRNEIMMKKDKILSDINKILPDSNIKDIK